MSITDEGVSDYVNQWHTDLGRIATALERIEERFEALMETDRALAVRVVNSVVFQEIVE